MFFFRGKGLILFRQHYGPQNVRVIRISLRFNYKPHRIVFHIHQVHGTIQGCLQILKSDSIVSSYRHPVNCLSPPVRIKRFRKILFQKAHVTQDGKALDFLCQIVRSIHQFPGRLSQFDLLL